MITLSTAAKLEANKMHGDGAWLVLLEINLVGVDTIYLCRNTEDIVWHNHTWIAFPFELDDIKETSKGELPSVVLKVSNVTRAVQGYLEQGGGGVGAIVTLRVVHSNHLELHDPEIEETFTCVSTKVDERWVSFELGAGDPVFKRLPPRRYMKNFCPFRYGGIECGLVNDGNPCNKTLTGCRAKGNSARFGGFITITRGGLYV